MGSQLSFQVCDAYMHCFEEKLSSVRKFPHWFRYMDNTFVLIPSNADSSILLSLNIRIDSFIQLTIEVENNLFLLFLDVLVSKHKTRFSTKMFSEYPSQFLFYLPLSPINRKWLLSTLTCFVLYIFAWTRLNIPMNSIT